MYSKWESNILFVVVNISDHFNFSFVVEQVVKTFCEYSVLLFKYELVLIEINRSFPISSARSYDVTFKDSSWSSFDNEIHIMESCSTVHIDLKNSSFVIDSNIGSVLFLCLIIDAILHWHKFVQRIKMCSIWTCSTTDFRCTGIHHIDYLLGILCVHRSQYHRYTLREISVVLLAVLICMLLQEQSLYHR